MLLAVAAPVAEGRIGTPYATATAEASADTACETAMAPPWAVASRGDVQPPIEPKPDPDPDPASLALKVELLTSRSIYMAGRRAGSI